MVEKEERTTAKSMEEEETAILQESCSCSQANQEIIVVYTEEDQAKVTLEQETSTSNACVGRVFALFNPGTPKDEGTVAPTHMLL